MNITLNILLIIYLVFLAGWTLFSLVALYHMLKFGFKNATTYLSVLIFIIISLAMLGISYFYIAQIDWNQQIFNLSSSDSEDFLFTP